MTDRFRHFVRKAASNCRQHELARVWVAGVMQLYSQLVGFKWDLISASCMFHLPYFCDLDLFWLCMNSSDQEVPQGLFSVLPIRIACRDFRSLLRLIDFPMKYGSKLACGEPFLEVFSKCVDSSSWSQTAGRTQSRKILPSNK